MNPVDWIFLAVVILGIAIAIFGWDRYRGRKSTAASAEPTGEVFNDPAAGQRMRVWYDPVCCNR